MSLYTGPRCRLCRREGMKLFLKGERCYTKCSLEKRNYPPGMHGQTRPPKLKDYGLRFREKQKAKRIYWLTETQFRRYVDRAEKLPGRTGENLLILLERRLDSVVFRLGFASSRKHARQLVTHGHIMVNDKVVDIPNYEVEIGDVIRVKPDSPVVPMVKEEVAKKGGRCPSWLELDENKLEGRVVGLPEPGMIEVPLNEQLIVEFYSR
ncbi:30S ribosomal protein S4 [bacterium]|nr:30S ribosomal protein S4 [bacterium]